MLLVPKYDTNLRNSCDCSLLCLEEPIQKVASGPLSFLMASSFWLTSLSAVSHETFCHLPPTSFIGVFRRCESCTMPCSRIEAPFAQCAPRLIGESKTGSCLTHTPFCTTASMAHPTEQCVQTVRFTSIWLAAAFSAASTSPTMLNGSWLARAPAPNVIPERLRNVRRSTVRPSMLDTGRVRRLGAAGLTLAFVALRVSSMCGLLKSSRCGSNCGRAR